MQKRMYGLSITAAARSANTLRGLSNTVGDIADVGAHVRLHPWLLAVDPYAYANACRKGSRAKNAQTVRATARPETGNKMTTSTAVATDGPPFEILLSAMIPSLICE